VAADAAMLGKKWRQANQEARRSAMITSLKHTTKCIRCGGRLSTPESCTYMDEKFVCYHWLCPKCGCAFDASTCLCQDAPIAPEIVEKFLPELLVA
jgi:hypothetical protein